jgi:hypothetical protein
VLAVISIPFVWAFRVIRASGGSEQEPESEPESVEAADDEESEPEAEAAAS